MSKKPAETSQEQRFKEAAKELGIPDSTAVQEHFEQAVEVIGSQQIPAKKD